LMMSRCCCCCCCCPEIIKNNKKKRHSRWMCAVDCSLIPLLLSRASDAHTAENGDATILLIDPAQLDLIHIKRKIIV
jgi:hypothetical protein